MRFYNNGNNNNTLEGSRICISPFVSYTMISWTPSCYSNLDLPLKPYSLHRLGECGYCCRSKRSKKENLYLLPVVRLWSVRMLAGPWLRLRVEGPALPWLRRDRSDLLVRPPVRSQSARLLRLRSVGVAELEIFSQAKGKRAPCFLRQVMVCFVNIQPCPCFIGFSGAVTVAGR